MKERCHERPGGQLELSKALAERVIDADPHVRVCTDEFVPAADWLRCNEGAQHWTIIGFESRLDLRVSVGVRAPPLVRKFVPCPAPHQNLVGAETAGELVHRGTSGPRVISIWCNLVKDW